MKRGYFFSVDIFIALLIILGGMYLIFSNVNPKPDVKKARAISSDISDFLFDLQIKDICWGNVDDPSCDCRYTSVATLYCMSGYDFNPEMNLFEVIGQVYVLHPTGVALGYIDDIIQETVRDSKLVPDNYNFSITLTNLALDPANATRIYPIGN